MKEEAWSRLVFEVGRVFTPASPISDLELFSGRLQEIRRISDAINSVGKHAILYGDRGVGKTSLASILKDFLTESSVRIGKANCEQKDTLASVWDKALAEIPMLWEGEDRHEEYTLNQWIDMTQYVGPGQIRRVLQQANQTIPELVIVFDEFDRLGREHQSMFADTIKDLADSMVGATVVLVGVAKNVSQLIADHASVSRNLAQIEMPPMTATEVRGILETGARRLNMRMTAESADTVVTLSQGFPHFAHLLGKESALSALNDHRLEINTADIDRAVSEAVKDNSYNVADEYYKATFAQRKGTLFEHVLISAALAEVDDLGYFASTDVKPVLNAITAPKKYEIYGFSQHLERFSSDVDRGPALEKRGSKRCYRYRFANPLLRPYAILKGMADGFVTSTILRMLANQPTPTKKKKASRPHLMPLPKQSNERTLFD